jgi:hypothetical protein
MNLLIRLIEDRRLGLATMGAIAVSIGSALPWIRIRLPLVGVTTGYGLQDDGKVTVVLGALALVLILAHAHLLHRDLAWGALLAALAAVGLAAAYIADLDGHAARVVSRLLSGGETPIDPAQVGTFASRAGAGPYVIFGGAAVVLGAVVALTVRAPGTSEPAPRSSS